MNSEASFLFSTFNEFYKCWRSGANSCLFIESVNGKAFINFSAFLGNPDDVHFKPWHTKRNPSKVQRKKSEKKIKRDNDRAARFQARKRKEEEEAASVSKSAADLEAIAASSPNPSSESVMTVSDVEFSFASPVPEVLRHSTSQDTSMILSNSKEQRVQKVKKGPTSCNILEQEIQSALNDEKEQKEKEIKIRLDSDTHDFATWINIASFTEYIEENAKDKVKEIYKAVEKLSFKDKCMELFKETKRLGLTDMDTPVEITLGPNGDKKGIKMQIETNIQNRPMVTGTPITYLPTVPVHCLEDFISKQKQVDSLQNLLSSIEHFKKLASEVFTLFKEEDFADEWLSVFMWDSEESPFSEK